MISFHFVYSNDLSKRTYHMLLHMIAQVWRQCVFCTLVWCTVGITYLDPWQFYSQQRMDSNLGLRIKLGKKNHSKSKESELKPICLFNCFDNAKISAVLFFLLKGLYFMYMINIWSHNYPLFPHILLCKNSKCGLSGSWLTVWRKA